MEGLINFEKQNNSDENNTKHGLIKSINENESYSDYLQNQINTLKKLNTYHKNIQKQINELSEVREYAANKCGQDTIKMVSQLSSKLQNMDNKNTFCWGPTHEITSHSHSTLHYEFDDSKRNDLIITNAQLMQIYREESNKACKNTAELLKELGFKKVITGKTKDTLNHACKIELSRF